MARTPVVTPARRQAAPPPPPVPEEVGTVYDEIWSAIVSANPKFIAWTEAEADPDFFSRLQEAVSVLPIPTWEALSPEAQAWYDASVTAAEARQELPAPPGFYGDDEGGEPEGELDEGEPDEGEVMETVGEEEVEEVEEVAPPIQPQRKGGAGAAALMKWNSERAAAKAAGAGAPAPVAPVAARRGRTLPAPIAPVVAPRRAAPIAPVVAPRRAAPTAQAPAAAPARGLARGLAPRTARAERTRADKPPSVVETIRQLIINDPGMTMDEILDYCEQNLGGVPKETTVRALQTTTRTCINSVKATGHWVD